MAISIEQAENLHKFIGYGRFDAPLWFIGLEEGLGSPKSDDEKEQNLVARSQWNPVMDMYEAHLTLHEGGKRIDLVGRSAKDFKVWRWMSRVCLYKKYKIYSDGADEANDFVRSNLGRINSMAFLSELSPIPKASQSAINPTEGIISTERAVELLAYRRNIILAELKKHKPTVICYGTAAKSRFSDFLNFSWEPIQHDGLKGKFSRAREFPNAFHLPFFGRGMSHELMRTFLEHCPV